MPIPWTARASSGSKFIAALALTLGLAVQLGCKPTTQRETQRWERNQIAVTELGERWPGFKAVLDAKQAEAQGAWEAASQVSDEEAKAQAMDAANDQFNPLLGKLEQVESKSQGVRDLITKVNRLKLSQKKTKARRSDLIDMAETALAEIDQAMRDAEPADEAAAVALAEAQISRLIGVNSKLKSFFDKYKTKVNLSGKKK